MMHFVYFNPIYRAHFSYNRSVWPHLPLALASSLCRHRKAVFVAKSRDDRNLSSQTNQVNSRVHSSGSHGLSCRFNAGRTARHTEANDIIRRALVSAGLPAVLEPLGLSRDDGKRPDGMTLTPWSRGLPLVWDFTCVDTLAPSNLPISTSECGKLAAFAERKKKRKYATIARECMFCPVAVETFGAWGPDAQALISDIGKRITDTTGERRATSFLKQRLSLAVQRGNAASVSSCLPKIKDFYELTFI